MIFLLLSLDRFLRVIFFIHFCFRVFAWLKRMNEEVSGKGF